MNSPRKNIVTFIARMLLGICIITSHSVLSQKLLPPRNHMEYMCVPLEIISNFEGGDEFSIDNGDFINGNTNAVKPTLNYISEGIENSKALNLTLTDVTDGGASFFLRCERKVFVNDKFEGIGIWLKSSDDATANFYFEDASGLVFYIPKELIEGGNDWKYSYAVTAGIKRTNTPKEQTNPEIQYPCKFLGLNFSTNEISNSISLDQVSKVKEITISDHTPFTLSSSKLANVYLKDDVVIMSVKSISDNVKVILKDYRGETIFEKVGENEIKLELPTSELGYHEALVLSYKDAINPENLVKGEVFQYGVMDGETFQNEELSVATHPQRDYYDIKSVDLTKILGAKYMRFGLVMEFMEQNDGTFALSDHTLEILNYGRAEDLKYICVFRDKTPPLTAEQTSKFLNFSRYLLDEYKNVIDKVELWNEWTHGTGTHDEFKSLQTPENYTKFLKNIYTVLKDEYPAVEFIGLGGENPQRFEDDIKNMYQAGAAEFMDAISLHPYRQPRSPDSRLKNVHNMNMSEQIENILEISKKYNGPEKVFITEIGYPGHHLDFGVSDYKQAEYSVKSQALLLTSNVVENITWYNLYSMHEIGLPKNYLGREDDYPQFHFGLFEGKKFDFAVKNSAMAYRFFAKVTNGFSRGSQYDDGKGFFRLTLAKQDGQEVEIVWNNHGIKDYPVDAKSVIYDMMGNQIKSPTSVSLDREPVYILKSKIDGE